MTLTEIASIANYILMSLGGAALVIFALSNWLGKVWADRLMRNETKDHEIQLAQLRTNLEGELEQNLSAIRAQLEVKKEALVREHADRVAIYRSAIDLVARIAAKLEMIMLGKRGPLSVDETNEFEEQRLRIYAYLAMHAPQSVMDAHDKLSDAILSLVYDGATITWPEFRILSTDFLNEVRMDIGIRTEPVYYRGTR